MIKSSNKERKITSEYIKMSKVPDNLIDLLECTNNLNLIKKISNKEGFELANYGINSFVRDIFINETTSIAIYSDRFGKYHKIKNEEIANFLANSNLHVTPEGILVFYSIDPKFSSYIYLTLNCEFGIFTKVSSLLNLDQKVKIYEIFNSNGKTFANVCIDSLFSSRFFYCLFEFSLNLYESYGSLINVKLHRLHKIYKNEVLKGNFESDFECTDIMKNRNIIKLDTKLLDCAKSKFKKLYMKDVKLEKGERIDSINIKTFSNSGDIKVNDCINAFVKNLSIAVLKDSTKHFSFNKDVFFKYILIVYNRYLNYNVKPAIDSFDITESKSNQNSIETHIAKTLYDSSIYVSLEGVLVSISVYRFNKIVVLISLDGLIWKSYDINENIISEKLLLKVEFIEENNYNYLILYDIDPNKPLKKYIFNFSFNFWDLYNYPVELSIDSIN